MGHAGGWPTCGSLLSCRELELSLARSSVSQRRRLWAEAAFLDRSRRPCSAARYWLSGWERAGADPEAPAPLRTGRLFAAHLTQRGAVPGPPLPTEPGFTPAVLGLAEASDFRWGAEAAEVCVAP